MSFGAAQQNRRPAVPLAAMLDILFLLLIFFVTTGSFRAEEQQIDVELPAAQAAGTIKPGRTELVINVRQDGAIVVGEAAFDAGVLGAMLEQLVRDFPDERVIIRGDREVSYHRIITVMDVARSAGVRNIYFATVKPAAELKEE